MSDLGTKIFIKLDMMCPWRLHQRRDSRKCSLTLWMWRLETLGVKRERQWTLTDNNKDTTALERVEGGQREWRWSQISECAESNRNEIPKSWKMSWEILSFLKRLKHTERKGIWDYSWWTQIRLQRRELKYERKERNRTLDITELWSSTMMFLNSSSFHCIILWEKNDSMLC